MLNDIRVEPTVVAGPTFVYRFYDAEGVLLYVGITCDPAIRWRSHSLNKDWWGDVADITAKLHPDRASALAEERRVIIAEKPVQNIKDVPAARRVERPNRRVPRLTVVAIGRNEAVYTVPEIAAVWPYSQTTIRKWIDSGDLPGVGGKGRHRRVRKADADAFAANGFERVAREP